MNVAPVFAHTATLSTEGEITVNVSPNGSGANLGTDSLNIVSTCPLGYTVSIAGPTDNALYLGGNSSNANTIEASSGTNANPASILGNNIGTWGYSTNSETTVSSNFIGLTNTANQIKTKLTASASGGDSATVFFGVSVDADLPPGIYTLSESSQGAGDDAITYFLTPTANCANYIIRYNGNGASSTPTMGITHNVLEDDDVTLATSNYKRSGYGFAGWSTVQLNPDSGTFQSDLATAVAAGKVFGPNETITTDATFLTQATVENNTQYITLYAVWVKPAQNAVLQNWRGCDSLSAGDVIALKDQRDNDVYAVAKLADGRCWMIENLRLDYNASHNSDGTLAQGYASSSTYGNFSGLAQPETANFAESTTANSLYYAGTQSGSATVNISSSGYPFSRFPRYSNANTNSTTGTMSEVSQNVYQYGNYYTWSAAVADVGYYDVNNSSITTTSICPAGWKLPKGGDKNNESNNEYWSLIVTTLNNGTRPSNYGSVSRPYYTGGNEDRLIRRYPNNFVFAGRFDDTSSVGKGTHGYYATSSVNGYRYGYRLAFGNSTLYPGTYSQAKYIGTSVRCIASRGYTVSFNANGGSGSMANQTIYEGEATNLSANSFTAPALGSSYQNASGTTIPGTEYTYWSFDGWNTAADGSGTSYIDEQSVTDLTAGGGAVTLYAQWKGVETLKVNYEGNGLEFSGGATRNTVYYYNDCQDVATSAIRYSHTSNISDDGTRNGTYTNNMNTNEVITISGASKLYIKLTYKTESTSYDWVSFWTGSHSDYTAANNYSTGVTWTGTGSTGGKYGGKTMTTLSGEIMGDTVTFAFRSDGSVVDYGYYAVIVGLDANGEPITSNQNTSFCTARSIVGGAYKTPTMDAHTAFNGWHESSSATTVNYSSADEILKSLPGGNGMTKTVYAIWDNLWVLTFVNTETNATQTKNVVRGQSIAVSPSTSWSKTNYSLAGWDTNSAGTNVVYTKGQSITPTSDITVYTVWKPAYTIVYNGNGADAGVMTNVKHTNVFENDKFDLFASNYSKANYGFAGWSFDSSAQPGGSSKIYGPNEAFVASAPTTPGETKTLYAVWVPAQTGVYMQNWNGCSSMSINDVVALKDQRDNQVYTVAKLADEACWMTENLRLEGQFTTNSYASLAQGYVAPFTGLSTSESANFSNSTTANSLYSTTNITGNNQGYRFPRYNNSNTNERASGPSVTDNRSTSTTQHYSSLSTATYSYGNYYTWAAAMANTKDYSGPTTVVDGYTSQTVGSSICPIGWRLPYGGNASGSGNSIGGFYYLNYKLNNNSNVTNTAASNNLRAYPNNFVFSGDIYNGSTFNGRGSNGYYWTSLSNSNTSSYYLSLSTTSVSPGTAGNIKSYGQSVRCVADTYTIILDGNGATTAGSSSTTTASGSTTLSPITVPQRKHTISGFSKPSGNNANGASVSSTSTLTSTYTFNGWYKESGATNKIASNDAIPVLQANTSYTNSNGGWTANGGVTLYAGWTAEAKTLPTITRPGYNCGWTETSSGATTIQYESGGSLAPSSNKTLYGVCVLADYTITINAGNGVGSVALSGWTGTGSATLTKTYHYGDTINLSSATPTYKTGYSGTRYEKIDSYGTLNGTTYTVGVGNGVININATTLATPVCTIRGGATKAYNRSSTTLTATSNAANYDTSSVNITYSFGYVAGSSTVDGGTADLGNFGTAQSSNTLTIAANAFRNAYGRFYGVRVVVTDKNDSTITSTCTSGTGYSTGTTVANRTRLIIVNSRIDFNATSNGGTLSGTSPVYVSYQMAGTFSSRTGSSARAIPSATPPTNLDFDGWYTAAEGGTKVVNADGTIVSSVSGWTDSSGRWIRTSTTNDVSASNTLYAHYTCTGGRVCYVDNGANSSTTMGKQTISASATEVTFWASNFQRSGYGFAGWNTKADGTGTNYGPNETITITARQYSSQGLILYAKWVASAGNLQGWTGCSSLASGAVTALKDTRDNDVYAVAKLADGKCWMIENLRLDSNASNNASGSLAQGYSSGFVGLADPEAPWVNVADPYPSNSLYSINGSGNTVAVYGPYRFPRYNNTNTSNGISNMTSAGQNVYSYGNYYTWAASVASIANNNSVVLSGSSICPKGWRLPYGGDANSTYGGNTPGGFYYLNYKINNNSDAHDASASKNARKYPNNFVYSGHVWAESFGSLGSYGDYWSSTSYTEATAYDFGIGTSIFSFSNPGGTYKHAGYSIRCVADN
ncbi:InlB B-repeat-containing protein [Candidatus Saccharibacteria bacterium]|nr:InlB B-repeat-containing protein [Candidatus Saccharibacteria bacterium]